MTQTVLNQSSHAKLRSQQRGVPSTIVQWLHDYGERRYDGRGGIIRFFSEKSRHRLEQEIGRDTVRRVSEHLRCYLIESAHDGTVITVAKQHRNTRLPLH